MRRRRRTHAFGDDPRAGEIHPAIEQVHMAAAPAGKPGRLAEDLGHHLVEVDALATAMWCGRWVAVTMSPASRCAQTPTAQGSGR